MNLLSGVLAKFTSSMESPKAMMVIARIKKKVPMSLMTSMIIEIR